MCFLVTRFTMLGRGGKVYLALYVHCLFLHAIQMYATDSDDMDALTFNAPTGILFRYLTFSEAKKQPISEINLKEAFEVLVMNMSQLFDQCIPLGRDYLEPIKDVGPKFALKLIREYGAS
ncbi:uncharacterized protein LACBIDRAFT_309563 [Laccaria bicolor S238N-H82]|uniref:Predicted protein n=1 Tax=Laccaria bicolor (strain S238N-H82 / ATCC MYA-4686) TaxID=486041 RepID=B0DSL0_LACBS|nr:uncharacterized protein LACBIDRAFT_309563 [Laccaria bicolor S238N-H82]EDR02567.1 predicted protein [Laccaria bicolor S238N-H82]|eukprot:XP_001886930.1 predicted protein [Laccaria bicolor S238N-H82]